MKKLIALSLLSITLAVPGSANAENETRIIDGDTLKIDGTTYRLWGIDSPEMGQQCEHNGGYYDCGELARMGLVAFVGESSIECEKVNTDRYRRVVARCSVDGHDLGSFMTEHGLALDYAHYSRGYYKAEQDAAESAERGIWAGDFTLPWVWRKERR